MGRKSLSQQKIGRPHSDFECTTQMPTQNYIPVCLIPVCLRVCAQALSAVEAPQQQQQQEVRTVVRRAAHLLQGLAFGHLREAKVCRERESGKERYSGGGGENRPQDLRTAVKYAGTPKR